MAIEKWIVTGPKVIDLELVRSVKISLIGGKIDMIAHDEPGARVEVHSVSGKDLKVSIDGDRSRSITRSCAGTTSSRCSSRSRATRRPTSASWSRATPR